jgi:hypothetical protein
LIVTAPAAKQRTSTIASSHARALCLGFFTLTYRDIAIQKITNQNG